MDLVLSRKIRVLLWFGICLVVWIHAFNSFPRLLMPDSLVQDQANAFNYLQYLVSNGLARFVMPMFFFLSGYLYFRPVDNPRPLSAKIARRIRSLLIPFAIWNCVGIAVAVAARSTSWLADFMPQYLRQMSWSQFGSQFLTHPVSFQLWYLADLFVLALLSPVIRWVCIRPTSAVIWIFIAGVAWAGENLPVPLLSLEGLLFFSAGATAALQGISLRTQVSFQSWLLVAVIWLGLSALRAWLAFGSGTMTQSAVFVLYKACILLGLWVIWFGYDLLVHDVPEESRWWAWLQSSFYVFAAHQPLYNVVSDNILARIGHHELLKSVNPGGAFLVYLLLPPVTICLLSLLGMALRERAAPVHRWLTGGR